jgi:hypothetical protein
LNPLKALHKRGYSVRQQNGNLIVRPKPPAHIVKQIAGMKAAIIEELDKHRAECVAVVEQVEREVLAANIDQDEAIALLVHAFTMTATAPTAHPACDCGENLLWSRPEDTATTKRLPPLCSRCHPPGNRRTVVWWLAE